MQKHISYIQQTHHVPKCCNQYDNVPWCWCQTQCFYTVKHKYMTTQHFRQVKFKFRKNTQRCCKIGYKLRKTCNTFAPSNGDFEANTTLSQNSNSIVSLYFWSLFRTCPWVLFFHCLDPHRPWRIPDRSISQTPKGHESPILASHWNGRQTMATSFHSCLHARPRMASSFGQGAVFGAKARLALAGAVLAGGCVSQLLLIGALAPTQPDIARAACVRAHLSANIAQGNLPNHTWEQPVHA